MLDFILPARCRVDQIIAKKVILQHAKLTSVEKRFLTSDVARITARFLLRPDVYNCPVYQDSDRLYDELHILELELRSIAHADDLETLLFRAIPYPIIINATCDAKTRLATALVRTNQNQAEKNVVESIMRTDWRENALDFAALLDFSDFNNANLYALASDFYDALCAHNLKKFYPNATIERANARHLLAKRTEFGVHADALQKELHREHNIANRLNLVSQLQNLQAQIDNLIS